MNSSGSAETLIRVPVGVAAKRQRPLLSYVLLLAACFIDGANEQLLPASLRALEADLGFTLANLGQLAMAQTVFMAILAPFWGSVADTGLVQNKVLLAVAVASWGVLTVSQSTVTGFYSMLVIRAFIGCCLACIFPISQIIICGQAAPEQRGRRFGWVCFAQTMGQVCSGLLTTSISNIRFELLGTSVMGWRLACLAIGMMSISLAMLIALCFEEPPRSVRAEYQRAQSVQGIFQDVHRKARAYAQISSCRVIVLQGIFGSVPWTALSFLPMFFQYAGFQDQIAAVLVMFMMMARGLGQLLGGYIGDFATTWSKRHGRIYVAQISAGAGIPCMYLLFRVVSPSVTHFTQYACVLLFHGVLASWIMTGVKRPILSEIVKSEDWASLFALDCALEGSSAAIFGAPVVALLGERIFGYKPVTGQVHNMVPEIRVHNQDALGTAMFFMTVGPWIICFILWTFMHNVFPKDVQAIEGYCSEDDFQAAQEEEAPLLKYDDDGCTSAAY